MIIDNSNCDKKNLIGSPTEISFPQNETTEGVVLPEL